MWVFGKSKTEAPVVHLRICLRLTERMVLEKVFRKELKKFMPYLTEEEVVVAIEEFGREGYSHLRVPRKVDQAFTLKSNVFEVTSRAELEDIDDACRCGWSICSGCVSVVKESRQYSKTNAGLIRDSESSREFDSETGEALVFQKQ